MIIAIFAVLTFAINDPAPALKIWLAGDLFLGNSRAPLLSELAPTLKDAIGIVNLEGPIAVTLKQDKSLLLFNDPKNIDQLNLINVRVASIANNHYLDAGILGSENTAKTLKQHNILPAGNIAQTAFFTQNNIKIAVAAFDLTNGIPANITADIITANKSSELLIVTFHVTAPASYIPTKDLQTAVDIAEKNGAKIIAAHGTHALGPLERKGNTIIAWGLGNLVFACDCTDETDAIILKVTVNKSDNKSNVQSVEVIPIDAGLKGTPTRLAKDPDAIFDLLEAIGSPKLDRKDARATF